MRSVDPDASVEGREHHSEHHKCSDRDTTPVRKVPHTHSVVRKTLAGVIVQTLAGTSRTVMASIVRSRSGGS